MFNIHEIDMIVSQDVFVDMRPDWLKTMCETLELPENLQGSDLGHFDESKGLMLSSRASIWMSRDYCISRFGYPVLTKQVMTEITDALHKRHIKTALEVAAGNGWFSHNLQKEGFQVITTDDLSWESDVNRASITVWKNNHFCDIEKLDATNAVEKYHSKIDCVIMSWPPYNCSMGYNVFAVAGRYKLPILYIGEEYGCCGDDTMWEFIYGLEEQDKLIETNVSESYISWDGIHDDIVLYEWV